MSNVSPHNPFLSGGVESVTGTKTIDTGQRTVQAFVAGLNLANPLANEEALVSWSPVTPQLGPTVLMTLRVEKGGTSSGTLGDSAVNVHWICLGK